ncbi:hypothetical protein HYPSUDRAFT_202398 [Hypholoma sublateritium FD-334 SS-4]|uniref:ATP synthase subunit H, mitochondrial n=1 Tax=Hypholoma sublateritium (strain FD-334 SS-4) TaxID=945553 RepID=A0A0D2NTH3_HYPSF|nr:hypothetical protein HYPSUDRAFT_202398 [Hypholoma sublateritium FD-334 SS-4]
MSAILRHATSAARQASAVRAFSASAAARKDLVQDLYLREIKAYKPAAKDAHVGVVKKFTLPPSPATPKLPTDLASDLAAYDASEPTSADAAPAAQASSNAADEPTGGAEGFLVFLEQDLPKPVHHH